MNNFDPRTYWEHRLEGQFSLGGAGLLGVGEPFNRWMYRVKAANFRRAVKMHGPWFYDPVVLDVAMGTGFYVDLWKSLGVKKLLGCDITTVAVQKMHEKYPEHAFFRLDIATERLARDLGSMGFEHMLYPGEGVDCVSAMDVLFHITDNAAYLRALKNLNDLLIPGGILIVTEDFVPDAIWVKRYRQTSAHFKCRSWEKIEMGFEDAGFERAGDLTPLLYWMANPVCSDRRLDYVIAGLVAKFASGGRWRSWLAGALMYGVDRVMTRFSKRMPTVGLAVYRKKL